MIIPVRCFTCNKTIGHLWENYDRLLKLKDKDDKQIYTSNEILEKMNIKRYCCKRMFISNIEIIDNMILYKTV
jgi:DNA-directed RNA polymerase subunit N (RpoN/RPB10)